MKHVDTAFLWVQELVTAKRVRLHKVGTADMLADFLTKHVPHDIMQNCMRGLHMAFVQGQSEMALKA